jgi:hypothetical protein
MLKKFLNMTIHQEIRGNLQEIEEEKERDEISSLNQLSRKGVLVNIVVNCVEML